MAVIVIPKRWMGQTLQEDAVKSALLRLQPELHFDLGGRHNIWHPYKETRQSVFYRGRHICSMDRGTLPEFPIWTLADDWIEVPAWEVKPGELAFYSSCGWIVKCRHCGSSWKFPQRPVGEMRCAGGCKNRGDVSNPRNWGLEENRDGRAMVRRKVRDRIVLVGWRHTLGKLADANVPAVTREAIERELGIKLGPKPPDAVEIDETEEKDFLDRRLELIA